MGHGIEGRARHRQSYSHRGRNTGKRNCSSHREGGDGSREGGYRRQGADTLPSRAHRRDDRGPFASGQYRPCSEQCTCGGRHHDRLCSPDMTVEERPSRHVERRGRRADRAHAPIPQLPWSQPRLTLEPSRILSDDQIESIHLHSLKVLEEIGMDVLLPEARDILAKAGAMVEGERVRIGREIILEALRTPPAEFTFHARNPAYSITLGGSFITFAPVGGPPNCSDAERGRRPGALEDNANFIRLAQFFNCIHTAGGGSVD